MALFETLNAVNVTLDDNKYERVPSKVGDAASALTGNPTASRIGRAIDDLTDSMGVDIDIDLDRGTVSVDRKSHG